MSGSEPRGAKSIQGRLVACHECDALQRLPPPPAGVPLDCCRCGAQLRHPRSEALERVLPLALAASVLFMLANTSPVVAIEVAGNRVSTSLLGAVIELHRQGVLGVALIVLATGLVAPAMQLVLFIYALSSLTLQRRFRGLERVVRLLAALRPWSMVEVFMLGVLVSLVKLAGLARVIPGIGLWSLFGVIVLVAAAHAAFDVPAYCERVRTIE